MFDIEFSFDDIKVKSVEKKDIEIIKKWIKKQNCSSDNHINKYFEKSFTYEGFLGYYVSECEFFLNIIRDSEILGIFKGRIEFKKINQVWFEWICFDSNLENYNTIRKIYNKIIDYFYEEYGIYEFYIKIKGKNPDVIRVLKDNNYNFFKFSREMCDERLENCKIMVFKKVLL